MLNDHDQLFDIYNDDLEVLEFLEYGNLPRKRHTRKHHYDDMDEFSFFKTFRLYKSTSLLVLRQIEGELGYENAYLNDSLSPMDQLLIALKFDSHGEHLHSIAQFFGVDTSTVSRCISKVSNSIANLYPQYCEMPLPQGEQMKFYDVSQFPRVVGVVDGTHIKIKNIGGDEGEIFRNRKGFHSLNVQVLVNSDMQFSDVVARWPGSAHDSTIFNNSRICARFEDGEFGDSIILGDSGYALTNFLMTPLRAPQTLAQRRYNKSFNTTRNMVERTIVIWKSRFRCLAYGLRLKVDKCMAISCAVLHNISRHQNEPEPLVEDQEIVDYLIHLGQINDGNQDDGNFHLGGRRVQNFFVNNYFNY